MKKIYQFHNYLRQSDSVVTTICASFILMLWMIPVMAHVLFYFPPGPLIRITFFLSFTLILLSFTVFTVYKELRETKFVLTDDELIKTSPNATITIPIKSVTRFRYVKILFRGYGLVEAGGERIKLPFLLDELSDLSLNLRSQLLRFNRDNTFKASDFDRFIRQAKVHDQSVKRKQRAIKPLIQIIWAMAVVNLLFANHLWDLPLFFALGWALISASFPLCAYLVSDWWISQVYSYRLRRDSQIQDVPSSSDIYVRIGLISAVFYLAAGILYKTVLWEILIYGM